MAKTTWRLNGAAYTIATITQHEQENVLQLGLDNARCMNSTKDNRAEMVTARYMHFQDHQK
jgi:aryl carrier-like protein